MQVGDKSDPARVVLEAGIIEALRRGKAVNGG
jgi:hypothetical protein